jgi:predicted transglutaminase-like cysteine proteinase
LINEIHYRDGTDGSYYPPARFFAESGVCKDFAVAKYLLLREAGFDASQLRLVSLAPRYNNTPDDWHVMLVVQYVLNNSGRARAYCSSRQNDALFEEVRQEAPGVRLLVVLSDSYRHGPGAVKSG